MVSLFSTKLEKLFDLRPSPAGFIFCSGGLSGLPCFRERRPESFSEEAGLFRGLFGMASAAVSGVVCASRVGHGVRAIRPGGSEWPREVMSGTARSISVSAGVCFCATACLRTLPSPLISVCFCVWGSPRTAVPLLCIPAAIPFLRRSLFSFVCASLQKESPDREGPGSFAAEILRLFRIISSVPSDSRPWRPSWPARDSST